jgi:hypothetical protein
VSSASKNKIVLECPEKARFLNNIFLHPTEVSRLA